jgi:hypothetical protein
VTESRDCDMGQRVLPNHVTVTLDISLSQPRDCDMDVVLSQPRDCDMDVVLSQPRDCDMDVVLFQLRGYDIGHRVRYVPTT